MEDFYKNTRACIDEYNRIQDKMRNCADETTDDEDEIIYNHCIYLAHAIIKDCGMSKVARQEMGRMADIINNIIKE